MSDRQQNLAASRNKVKAGRARNGFSLVAIAMISLMVSLIMVGSGAALLSFYKTNATDLQAELQTSAIADSAANYLTALLCDPESRASYEVSVTDPVRVVNISPAELNLPLIVASHVVSIKAIIRNVAPANQGLQSGDNSKDFFPMAYDPRIDPINSSPLFTTNYWRTLTVLVQYGNSNGSTPYSKGLKIALKPTAKVFSPGTPGMNSPTDSFFKSAVYGKDSIALASAVTTESFSDNSGTAKLDYTNNVKVGGHIGAGSRINLDPAVSVGGQVQFNSPQTSVSLTAHSSSRISEIIQYPTGSTFSVTDSDTLPTNLVQQLGPDNSYPNPTVTAAPSINDVPSLAAPDKTPSFSSDITTPQGDYVIEPSQISSSNLTNLSNPVRLFIESTGGANESITFPNNLGTSNLPANLQIWYNGRGTLNLNGQNISSVVYAPYAKVTLGTTNGQPTSFAGSIIGNEVSVKANSKMRFDSRLATPSYSNVGFDMGNLDFTSTKGANSLRWQVQSVKELNGVEFSAESAI